MKVLIIGSGGFIGRYLLHHLVSQEIEVVGVSSADNNGIEPHTGILSAQFSIPPGTEALIYLAQSPHYRQVPEMAHHLLNVNLVSAVKVADMARQAKVKRFIYTSTGNVYAPSFQPLAEDAPLSRNNWYALSKIQAEEALALFRNDLDITIARLFGVYGLSQTDKLIPNLLNSVARGKKVNIQKNPTDADDLDGLKVSFIYIDDLVKILTNLLLFGNDASYLNIAGDEVISIRQIGEMISTILQKEVKLEVSDLCRQFDLIADIRLLQNTLKPTFTKFATGIERTITHQLQSER